MKTILLTGGVGFLGSRLALKFINSGWAVLFWARNKGSESVEERITKSLGFWDPNYTRSQIQQEEVNVDITKPLPKIKLKDINVIVHCAASISFRGQEENDFLERENILKINFGGTKNVLDFALEFGIPLHYISTAYVAGDREGKIFEDELDCGQKFHNPYEESKFLAEKMLRENMGRLPIAVHRPSIIVGDSVTGQTSTFTGFYGVYRIFHLLKKRMTAEKGGDDFSLPINLFCNPASESNLVPVDFVADTIFALVTKGESAGKTFHITNESPPNFGELTEKTLKIMRVKDFFLFDVENPSFVPGYKDKIAKAMERIVKNEWEPYFPYISRRRVFDCRNARAILGDAFKAPQITEDLLKKLLDYATDKNFGREKEER